MVVDSKEYAFEHAEELLIILSNVDVSARALQHKYAEADSKSCRQSKSESQAESSAYQLRKVEFTNLSYTLDIIYRLCQNMYHFSTAFLREGSKLDVDGPRKSSIRANYGELSEQIRDSWLAVAHFGGNTCYDESPEKSIPSRC
jgi:hypothetical protein